MSKVQVGQWWDFVGTATDAPPGARGWRCVVVRANDSREAGADSWVMLCLDTGRAKYMHHAARIRGEWRHVTLWRRLCDWFWRGEAPAVA